MAFNFNEWWKEAKLTRTTVEKLETEDLTTAEALVTLSEKDIKSLGLTIGQRNLLKNEVEKLKRQNVKASSDNADSVEAMDQGDESEQSQTPGTSRSARGENETSKRQKRTESSTKKRVLILNDEWGTSKGGISTVHRQVAQQAKDAGFDVHVTTLEEPSGVDFVDAEEKEIKIITAIKKGSTKKTLDCVNITHKAYFPELEEKNFEVIIGHIPITSKGATDIKDERLKRCRVFQFAHTIPEDTDVFKEGTNPKAIEDKEQNIIELAKHADVVFSVGPRIYNHYDGKFRRLSNVVHKQYIPYPDKGFFDLQIKPPLPNHPVRVLTVGRVDRVAHLKGYDIIVEALSKVCDFYKAVSMPFPRWDIRGIPEDKHEESRNFIDGYKKSKFLQYILHPYGTQKDIMEDLKQSHLFIMPSRSEPFGMVGMEAIAAGLPVLVTKHSGLADFIEKHFNIDAERMVVDVGLNDYGREEDVKMWRKRIIDALISKNIENTFSKAAEIKKKLQSLGAITDTHKEFQNMLQRN